jgi:hypothetical protein
MKQLITDMQVTQAEMNKVFRKEDYLKQINEHQPNNLTVYQTKSDHHRPSKE